MIDIIVPTYNRTRYLAEALGSIRIAAAKAKAAVDIIVVDDHSDTDESAYVAEAAGAIYLRHAENHGVAQALVTGFDASSAPFTAFFGDDDVMLPNWFERHIAVMDTGADVVSSSYYVTDADLNGRQWRVLQPVTLDDLRANIVAANDGSLIRRTALDGIPWRPELGRSMMLAMWLALASAGRVFDTITEPCWLYRRHEANMSGRHGIPDPAWLARRREVIAQYQ